MLKTNTKGRYGYLVSIVTTMFDFVLLNIVYFCLSNHFEEIGAFGHNVVWVFANISYAPVLMLFSDVHNKRILYADRIMIILFQALILL